MPAFFYGAIVILLLVIPRAFMPEGIRFSLSIVGDDDHIGPQAQKTRSLRCHSEEQRNEESPSMMGNADFSARCAWSK